MSWLPIVALVFVILTIGVLFLGIGSFVRGGEFNRKHGNTFMRLRVIFQFGAIMVLLLLFLLTRH
jgi:hypothetical protein